MAVPFHTFIVKVASRCNLNCDYCFVYNRGDTSWKTQPAFMSEATASLLGDRIREHCLQRAKDRVSIVFHGGEPLLGGAAHLRALATRMREALLPSGITPTFGMQSNGVLLTLEMARTLSELGFSIGISIDGPRAVNDRHRVDHLGSPSTARLEANLSKLARSPYAKILSGFLAVVDVSSDPLETYRYLASFDPPSIDFLMPYDNHDRKPPGKAVAGSPYADWLIPIFDAWYDNVERVKVRQFRSIMQLLLGGDSLVESIGLDPVDLIVVETDGSLEAVDSLKAAYDGAAKLGYHLARNSFDEVMFDLNVRARHLGVDSLCETCRSCSIVDVCGGGYLPNRYSRERGFANPSVYCTDLSALILHIHGRLKRTLQTAGIARPTVAC